MDEAGATTILKRDALGRVTITRERREALLDEFERGGLKGMEFARVAGINYQTFASWVQKRRHARGDYGHGRKPCSLPKAPALRLVEAVLSATPEVKCGQSETVSPKAPALEVLLPGGAKMLIANSNQVALAAQLLKALRPSSC